MKQISSGFLVFNKEDRMLACHPTGRGYTASHCFDIPKGHVDEKDLDFLETAKRELAEETGLEIPKGTKILSMGQFEYRYDKDLVIYVVKLDFDVNDLHCDSTFERNGEYIKEMDSYIVTYDTSKYFKNLQPIIEEICSNKEVKEYLSSYNYSKNSI